MTFILIIRKIRNKINAGHIELLQRGYYPYRAVNSNTKSRLGIVMDWGKKIVRGISLGMVLCVMGMTGGCVLQQGNEKLQDLEYTVVKPEEVPETLKNQIEEEKEAGFSLTYSDEAYLYIARGYGQQETGGYSIAVEECYLAENAICVETVLQGPQVGEKVHKEPSYPYIVLKTELREEKVVFR